MNNQQARSSVDGVGDAGCAEEVAWSWKFEIPSDTKTLENSYGTPSHRGLVQMIFLPTFEDF